MGAQRRRSPGGRRPGARRRRAAATCGRARIRGVRTRRRARAEAGGHGSDRDRHLWRVAPPGVRACGQELQETEGLGCGRGMKGASAIRSPVKRTLICIVLAAVTCLAAVWAAAHEPGRPLVAAGGAGSPAALENVRLVAIDPSEDGDIEEVSLRLD